MPKKKKRRTKAERESFTARRNFTIIIAVFLICIGIIVFRNVLINQSFSESQGLQKEIASLQKENSQISVNIQNNLNLSTIENLATTNLGMQKLSSRQTYYISLDTKDYVEVTTEQVEEEKESIIKTLWEKFWDLF